MFKGLEPLADAHERFLKDLKPDVVAVADVSRKRRRIPHLVSPHTRVSTPHSRCPTLGTAEVGWAA